MTATRFGRCIVPRVSFSSSSSSSTMPTGSSCGAISRHSTRGGAPRVPRRRTPRGRGSLAFILAESPTSHSVTQIAPLLFPGAGLTGALTEFGDATDAGLDTLAGHPCHKLVGVAQSMYEKPAESSIGDRPRCGSTPSRISSARYSRIHRRGTAGTLVSQVTTTFSPHANPPLDDDRFRFRPPSGGL